MAFNQHLIRPTALVGLMAVGIMTATCAPAHQGEGPRSPREAPTAGRASAPPPFLLIGSEDVLLDQKPVLSLHSREWDRGALTSLQERLRALPALGRSARAVLCARGKTEFGRLALTLRACHRAGLTGVVLAVAKEPPRTTDKAMTSADCMLLELPPGRATTEGRRLEITLGEEGYVLSHTTGEIDRPVERVVIPKVKGAYDVDKLRAQMTKWRDRDQAVTVSVENGLPLSLVPPVLALCRQLKAAQITLQAPAAMVVYPYREPTAQPARRPAVPRPPAGGEVVIGEVAVRGGLDADVVGRMLKLRRQELKRCFDAALKRSADVTRNLVLSLNVATTGQVVAATVEPRNARDGELLGCVSRAAKGWLFSKPTGGGVAVVTAPLTLK